MNLFFVLFMGFTIGLSGAMIPGPFTLFTASEVLKSNRFAGFKTVLGHIIFEFILIVAIFLGFQKALINERFLLSVSIIGGSAFIIMGGLLFLKAGQMKISNIKTDSGFNKGLVLGGIFFSIVSPGFLVWWATIGFSTIVKVALLGIINVIALVLGHWLADILWYGFLSYAIEKGRVYLNDRLYQNIIRFLSILLVILGVHFLAFKHIR